MTNLASVFGLVLALAATSARADPSPAPSFPPLHVDCRGEPTTAATVVLEAGAFGTSADWDLVLNDLAPGGRACAFDRAGLGQSPPRPGEKDALTKAGEINGLLDQIGETRPVILVGHSNGALYIEAFAALWPKRVAGLVYVNGVGADAAGSPPALADLRAEHRFSDLAVSAGRLGLGGAVVSLLTRSMRLPARALARKRAGLRCQTCLETARDEDRLIVRGLDAVRRLGPVSPAIPVVVIEGSPRPSTPLAGAWRAAEIAPATRARRSWVLDMPGATHVSPLTRDRAYITAAVAWLRSLAPSPDPDIGR
jgi:pimeloyl-ACP methyl ester carboxylesterase